MKKRTYADKPLGDTEWLLEQWGYWRMDGMGMPRYVSPLQALIRNNNVSVGGLKEYSITDDLALAVDSAVSRLSKRDQQMGDFIWLYFGAKYTAVRVGRTAGMGEAKARELIKAGVAWIDAAMEAYREAA
ncbi:antiterminator Q family protein [Phytopseudomonas daroniae]|uniref:antiterminator Q family protein n=1 Tax=Phytopseudomonas daroniae TaxID=2487519 RepID=UPI0010384999|nr:antiterminator Q family protein [Pseudomonas daroniae]TBU73292.1 antitermination protein Q [Pseudomonas daroniae]